MNRNLVITAIAISLVLCCAGARAGNTVKALKLDQTHLFFGRSDVVIAREGIRVTNHGQFGFGLVAKAPDWKVTVFRNDDKIYFAEPLDHFEQTGLVSDIYFSFRDRSLQSNKYLASDILVNNIPVKKLEGGRRTEFEYLPANSVQPQIEKIAFGMYKMPTNGGFPVSYKTLGSGKDWMTGMERSHDMEYWITLEHIERANVDPAIFDPPKSFKKVDSMIEALSSKERRTNASDSFRGLFGGK
jgi:hypothetical protein